MNIITNHALSTNSESINRISEDAVVFTVLLCKGLQEYLLKDGVYKVLRVVVMMFYEQFQIPSNPKRVHL